MLGGNVLEDVIRVYVIGVLGEGVWGRRVLDCLGVLIKMC